MALSHRHNMLVMDYVCQRERKKKVAHKWGRWTLEPEREKERDIERKIKRVSEKERSKE